MQIVLEEHFEEVNVTLQMKEANLQSVTKSNKQLQEKMTQIKLENVSYIIDVVNTLQRAAILYLIVVTDKSVLPDMCT